MVTDNKQWNTNNHQQLAKHNKGNNLPQFKILKQ